MADPQRAEAHAFIYDRLLYPGSPHYQTHPGRLATLALLHGMDPAPPAHSRVLEIGCGDGGNLIPVAYQYPDSRFLGIDLSARAIENGLATVAALGLRNIELRALDLTEVTPELGQFDYAIAHGVYSWTPPPVRSHMLSIFRRNLAPQGVAFVSYNCYPGSYLRDLSRAIMLFHVRDADDAAEKVSQARLLLHHLAEASTKNVYGLVLRSQDERVHKMQDFVLYHDDLDSGASAFFLYQVVEEAARHGLQYLADACIPLLTGPLLELNVEPTLALKLMEQIPAQNWLAREQYLDFLEGRMFRGTLLCHRDVRLERPVAARRIRDLHISASILTDAADLDPSTAEPAEFRTAAGERISTNHPLGKAALLHLGAIWPRTIGFADLVTAALARLGAAAERVQANLDAEVDQLTGILFRSFCAGMVELEAFPAHFTLTISERPQASLLARRQAELGLTLTNLRHCAVPMEDAVTRRLVMLLDGSRTLDQLVAELSAVFGARQDGQSGADAPPKPIISPENVVRNLQLLAQAALLVA